MTKLFWKWPLLLQKWITIPTCGLELLPSVVHGPLKDTCQSTLGNKCPYLVHNSKNKMTQFCFYYLLSGRSGSAYYLTRDWLMAHGFPPGLILHTDKHAPTLPIYASVGVFKRELLLGLAKQFGMKFGALYGNRCPPPL